VAYELIEHVPDVDALLDDCEAMLTRNGRVYLSTPTARSAPARTPTTCASTAPST
jgi:2-polyprenyl-3-methyl-5-hydroxy-6-metoxy-1,4-benzoquinol methylase